jgi:hypothetical protein
MDILHGEFILPKICTNAANVSWSYYMSYDNITASAQGVDGSGLV